ncbi:nucleotide sugar dehydrogenase [Streptomyces sp. NBC_00056]
MEVVWNPEFLREGHAVEDTLRPDQLIARVSTAEGGKAIRAVYAQIIDAGVPIFVTDPQTAELAKGATNTFLGLKISYINAVADMCEAAGGDVSQIVDILGIDPRIGAGGMRPGIGYGGGCLPKDVRAFSACARQLGAEQAATLLRAAEEINENRTNTALRLITRALGERPIKGAHITVWGAAFKPGTNDVRESPALALSQALQQAGGIVTVHDPRPCPRRWSATRSWTTPTTWPLPSTAPSSSSWPPNGPNTGRPTLGPWSTARPIPCSLTAAPPSTPNPGARRAGPSTSSDAPESRPGPVGLTAKAVTRAPG